MDKNGEPTVPKTYADLLEFAQDMTDMDNAKEKTADTLNAELVRLLLFYYVSGLSHQLNLNSFININ